ncbi:MAG: hypothetical protein WCK43_04575 [bacterium]
MGRVAGSFLTISFYSLLITGKIQNVPERFIPQTIRNLKELSANFQPLISPQKKSSTSQKNLREALRGYSDQEIQRMLDIASAQ